MPLSSYFNGGSFRPIDDTAALDTAPLTAPLEAQIANNCQWLHTYGGGESLKAYRSGGAWTGSDLTQYVGIKPHQIHHQPFLLTRGLAYVDVILTHVTTKYDMNLVVGIGTQEVRATLTPWPTHVQTTIRVEFPAPLDAEYFTDLTIWASCTGYDDPTTTTPDVIDWINEGVIRFHIDGSQDLTTNRDRVLLISNEFEDDDTSWVALDHCRKPPAGSPISTAFMNSTYDTPTGVMTEAATGVINLRSVQVIQYFK